MKIHVYAGGKDLDVCVCGSSSLNETSLPRAACTGNGSRNWSLSRKRRELARSGSCLGSGGRDVCSLTPPDLLCGFQRPPCCQIQWSLCRLCLALSAILTVTTLSRNASGLASRTLCTPHSLLLAASPVSSASSSLCPRAGPLWTSPS